MQLNLGPNEQIYIIAGDYLIGKETIAEAQHVIDQLLEDYNKEDITVIVGKVLNFSTSGATITEVIPPEEVHSTRKWRDNDDNYNDDDDDDDEQNDW